MLTYVADKLDGRTAFELHDLGLHLCGTEPNCCITSTIEYGHASSHALCRVSSAPHQSHAERAQLWATRSADPLRM